MAQEKTFSVHYDTTATANDPAEETLDYTSFSSSLQPSPITVPSHRKSITNTNNNNLHNSTNTNSNTIKSLSSSSSTVTTASSNSATTTTSISSSHQNYSNIDTDSINTHTTDTTHLSPSSQLVSSETTTEDSTVATNNTTSTTTATNSISQIIPKNRSSSRISAQRQSKILSVSGSGTGGSGDGHNNHSDFLDLNGGKENTINQSCSSESITTTTNTTATNTHTTTSIMKNSDKKKPSSSSKTSDKKKYENYPVKNIKEPHSNDVLYGRGGGTNHHPGNKKYRKMVETRKIDYVNSKRLDKPLVALEIIKEWRSQDPPGRFLKLDEDSGLWQDVGDKKAREKTSQALREKAPMLRKQQEELLEEQRLKDERDTYGGSGVSGHSRSSSFHSGRSSSAPSGASRRGAGGSSTPSSSSRSRKSPHHKTTRFSAGTNTSTSNRPKRVSRVSRGGVNGRGSTGGGTSPSGSGGANHSIAPALLARDHSLGRDWIRADDPLTVHNFSWDTEAVTSGMMMGGVMPLDPPDENEEKLVDRNMNSGLNQSFDERMQSAWIQRSPSSGATGTTTSPQYAIRGSGRMSPKTSSYYATSSGGPHDPVSSPIPSQHHERGGGGYHHEDYHPMSPQRLHPHDSSRSASSTPSRPTFYTERGHSLALNPLQNASTTMSAPLDAFPQSRTTRAVATTATGGSNNTGDITGNMVDSSPKTPKDGKQIPASKWIQRSRPIDDVVPVSIPPPSSSTSSSLHSMGLEELELCRLKIDKDEDESDESRPLDYFSHSDSSSIPTKQSTTTTQALTDYSSISGSQALLTKTPYELDNISESQLASNTILQKKIFHVIAPPGKLDIVIDTPGNTDESPLEIHRVRDTCPIADQINVGDELIQLDDEDVTFMTSQEVSKLISDKRNCLTRKLTLVRQVSVNENDSSIRPSLCVNEEPKVCTESTAKNTVINQESRSIQRGRVAFVGQGGSGKTAFLRALRGKDFRVHGESTVGIDIYNFHTDMNTHQDGCEDENAYSAWAEVTKSNDGDQRKTLNKIVQGDDGIEASLTEEVAETHKNDHDTRDQFGFSVWDYGSQDMFRYVQRLFVPRNFLYVVVFRITDLLDEGKKDLAMENIREKVESIRAHTYSKTGKHHLNDNLSLLYAPVVFVGTYYDQVKESFEPETALQEANQILVDEFISSGSTVALQISSGDTTKGREFLYNQMQDLLFWPVDNTDPENDDNIRKLRHFLVRGMFEDHHSYFNDPIPLDWLELVDRLAEVSKTNPLLPIHHSPDDDNAQSIFSIICEINQKLDNTAEENNANCASNLQSEVRRFVLFGKNIGLLLHFDDVPGLKEYCILDPKWLADVIMCVIRDMKLHHFHQDYDALSFNGGQSFTLLIRDGILEYPLLQRLWMDYDEGYHELLVHLMIKLGLFATLPINHSLHPFPRFFVPAVVNINKYSNLYGFNEYRGNAPSGTINLQHEIDVILSSEALQHLNTPSMDAIHRDTFKFKYVTKDFCECVITRLVGLWQEDYAATDPILCQHECFLTLGGAKYVLVASTNNNSIHIFTAMKKDMLVICPIVHHIMKDIDFYLYRGQLDTTLCSEHKTRSKEQRFQSFDLTKLFPFFNTMDQQSAHVDKKPAVVTKDVKIIADFFVKYSPITRDRSVEMATVMLQSDPSLDPDIIKAVFDESQSEQMDFHKILADEYGITNFADRCMIIGVMKKCPEPKMNEQYLIGCFQEELPAAMEEERMIRDKLASVKFLMKTIDRREIWKLDNDNISKMLHLAMHGGLKHPETGLIALDIKNDKDGIVHPGFLLERIVQCSVKDTESDEEGERGSIQCIFLNACNSRGIANELKRESVPWIISWETIVNSVAAKLFAESFYECLCKDGREHSYDYLNAYRRAEEDIVLRGWRLTNPLGTSREQITVKHAAGVPHLHVPLRIESQLQMYERDIFIMYNGRQDCQGRHNYDRVWEINNALNQRGYHTWFDQSGDHDRNKRAIKKSKFILVCITRAFLSKVEGKGVQGSDDACFRDFFYARQKCMECFIPIVMEDLCADTSTWSGPCGKYLTHLPMIDFTNDSKLGELLSLLEQRINSSIFNCCIYVDVINFRFVAKEKRDHLRRYFQTELERNTNTRTLDSISTSLHQSTIIDGSNGFVIMLQWMVRKESVEKFKHKIDTDILVPIKMLCWDNLCCLRGGVYLGGGTLSAEDGAKKLHQVAVKKFSCAYPNYKQDPVIVDDVMGLYFVK